MVKRSKFYWVLFVSLIVALPAKALHRQPVPDCDGVHCDTKCGCEEGMFCNKDGLCESDHGCLYVKTGLALMNCHCTWVGRLMLTGRPWVLHGRDRS